MTAVTLTGFAATAAWQTPKIISVGYDDYDWNGTITDNGNLYPNEADLVDGSLSTFIVMNNGRQGDQATNYLRIEGNSAPATAPTGVNQIRGFSLVAYGEQNTSLAAAPSVGASVWDSTNTTSITDRGSGGTTNASVPGNAFPSVGSGPGWTSTDDSSLMAVPYDQIDHGDWSLIQNLNARVWWSDITNSAGLDLYQISLRVWHDRSDALYAVGIDSTDGRLRIDKSTDGGDTWAEQDAANAFLPTGTLVSFAAQHYGNIIIVYTVDNVSQPVGMTAGSADITAYIFHIDTDTWQGSGSLVATPSIAKTFAAADMGLASPQWQRWPVFMGPSPDFTGMGSDQHGLDWYTCEDRYLTAANWSALQAHVTNQAIDYILPRDRAKDAAVPGATEVSNETYAAAHVQALNNGAEGIYSLDDTFGLPTTSFTPSTAPGSHLEITMVTGAPNGRLWGAFDPFNEQTAGGVNAHSGLDETPGNASDFGHCVLWDRASDDLYAVVSLTGNRDELLYHISTDQGSTWGSASTLHDLADASTIFAYSGLIWNDGAGTRQLAVIGVNGTNAYLFKLGIAGGNQVALDGTGDAAADGTGSLSVQRALAGTGDAASAGTGTLSVALALSGTGNNAADGTGTATITRGLAGTGNAAAAGTGTLTLLKDLAGTGNNANAGTGAIDITRGLAGSGDASSDGTGALAVARPLTGTGNAANAGTGALTLALAFAGTGDASSDGTGDLSPTRGLTGTGSAASAGTGTLTLSKDLAGTGNATSAGTGTVAVAVALTGSGAASSDGTGTISLTRGLAGTGDSASDGTGELAVAVTLTGTGNNASDGTGELTIQGQVALDGTGNAASAGTGAVTLALALTGSGAASSDGTGTLDVTRGLAGSGAASSAGTANITLTVGLAGSGASASDGTGDLTVVGQQIALDGTGSAAAAGTGALNVLVDLTGSGSAASDGTGTLLVTRGLTGSGSASAAGTATLTLSIGLAGQGANAAAGTGILTIAGALWWEADPVAHTLSTVGFTPVPPDAPTPW